MKSLDIKSFVQKLRRFSIKRHIPHRVENVWLAFLIIFLALTLAVFIWSFSLFLQLSETEDSLFAVGGQSIVETINRAELEELLEELHIREQEFKTLTSETVEPILEEDEEVFEDEKTEDNLE